MKYLLKTESLLQKLLLAIGAFFLTAMLVITGTDILVRQAFQPVPGVIELMGLFGALVIACALGYTQQKKDHIAVDILTSMYPRPLRKAVNILNRLACLAFSIIAAWQVERVANTLRTTGEVTETLRMIYYPFTYVVFAGFCFLALVFFIELLRDFTGFKEPAK